MLDPTKSLHTLHNMDRNFSIEKQRNHGRRSNPLGTKDIESGATRGGYQWLVVSWLLTPPHSQYSLCLRIIMWLLVVFTIMKSLFELSDNLSSLWPPFPTWTSGAFAWCCMCWWWSEVLKVIPNRCDPMFIQACPPGKVDNLVYASCILISSGLSDAPVLANCTTFPNLPNIMS